MEFEIQLIKWHAIMPNQIEKRIQNIKIQQEEEAEKKKKHFY